MMRRRQVEQQSRVLHDLSSLLLDMLRSPMELSPAAARRMTPAGFAYLMLGISMALMFCGSLTFFIGFMLIPWVVGLFMFLYFLGFISALSLVGRSILYYATPNLSSLPPPPPKDIPAWNLRY